MSDREFDNYLSLLSGLLRLRGKQRDAIAEELRSHLEDRLEELVAQGVAREAAIQQTLAEFGDAEKREQNPRRSTPADLCNGSDAV